MQYNIFKSLKKKESVSFEYVCGPWYHSSCKAWKKALGVGS